MNQRLTHSERQLLVLVGASLWQKPVVEEEFLSGPVDWNMIGRLAIEQTVGGLVFESALTLQEKLLPPKEWIRKALAFIETNRRTHLNVNRCVAEAVKRLRGEGIETVLLKGQAYASVYPKPEMRQCGDVDLYVGEDNYEPAYKAVGKFGWESKDEFKPEEKHYGCVLHGVKIELHRVAAKLLPRSVDRKFQQWSSDNIFRSGRTISLAEETIAIPTPLFDIVFVFLHLYHHFLNGGIGLRHVCDWGILLHAHSCEINPDELQGVLESLRLLKAWKIFAPILVRNIGLPEGECLLYSKGYEKQAERVLSTIFSEGNFGMAKTSGGLRPKGYFAGKIHSAKVVSWKYLQKFWFDPKMITLHLCSFIVEGTVRVIKDMSKGATR